MDTTSDVVVSRYYQTLVVFHALKDVENYYKVEATNTSDAKKRAIQSAIDDLKVVSVQSVGSGFYGVDFTFAGIPDSNKSVTICASKEVEAIRLAKEECKKDFDAKVIFYVEK